MDTLPNPCATSNPNCKRCKKCQAEKPLAEFHKHSSGRDGLRSQCKECVRERVRGYREKNLAKLLEKNRRWVQGNREHVREYHRRQRVENREHILSKQRRSYQKHREKHRERCKEYYQKNRDRLLANMRAYAKANRNKWPEYSKRYRKKHKLYLSAKSPRRMALLRGLPSDFTEGDIEFGLSFWRSACAVCGTPFGLIEKKHWDHWIPLSDPACPGTVPENMIPLCSFCNVSKGGRRGTVFLDVFLGGKKARDRARKVAAFFAIVRKR